MLTILSAIHDVDVGVFLFFKSLWTHWPGLDTFVEMLTDNALLKAGPILVAVWSLWFVKDADSHYRRTRIVSLLGAGCSAALFSVALTKILPLRPRPVFEPLLGATEAMPGWSRVSSLPSDHAALFVALAVGLIFVSRFWGTVALLDALLFVCVPRAYLGLHYTADLVAGASIGVAFALLFNSRVVHRWFSERVVAFEGSWAPVLYASLFLLTFEIGEVFQGARQVAAFAARAGSWAAHGLQLVLN